MSAHLPAAALGQVRAVLERHPAVERAAIFGSRALDRARPESDLDLALWGPIDDAVLARIRGELDDLSVPWLIDVEAFDAIRHPPLREHILRVGQTFYVRAVAGAAT